MVHKDYWNYRTPDRELIYPMFTDFFDARWAHAHGGKVHNQAWMIYYQWLHCVGNWGEEHSMCQKARFYVHRLMPETELEMMDKKKKLGFFDHIVLYGKKPFKGFEPLYQPVKKNRPGAYEWWSSLPCPIAEEDAHLWKEKAPILQEILVEGKKPVWDSDKSEDSTAVAATE